MPAWRCQVTCLRVTEETIKQKSENHTGEFQFSHLTIKIVMLYTSGLKTFKALFLLPSHVVTSDLEALLFLTRFCPVPLFSKYFILNTFSSSSHFHYSCRPQLQIPHFFDPPFFPSQFLASTRFSNSPFSLLPGPFNLCFNFPLFLLQYPLFYNSQKDG